MKLTSGLNDGSAVSTDAVTSKVSCPLPGFSRKSKKRCASLTLSESGCPGVEGVGSMRLRFALKTCRTCRLMLMVASASLASTSENACRLGTGFWGSWSIRSPLMRLPGVPCASRLVPLMLKSPVADHTQSGWSMSMPLMLHWAMPEDGAIPSKDQVSRVSGSDRWWVGVATNFCAVKVNGMDSQRASSPLPMHSVRVVWVDEP